MEFEQQRMPGAIVNPTGIPNRGPMDEGDGLNLRSSMSDPLARISTVVDGVEMVLVAPKIVFPYVWLEQASALNYDFEVGPARLQGRQFVAHINKLRDTIKRANVQIQAKCRSRSDLDSQMAACQVYITNCVSSIEQLAEDSIRTLEVELDALHKIPTSMAIDLKMGATLLLLAKSGLLSLPENPGREVNMLPVEVKMELLRQANADPDKPRIFLPEYHNDDRKASQAAAKVCLVLFKEIAEGLPGAVMETVVQLTPLNPVDTTSIQEKIHKASREEA